MIGKALTIKELVEKLAEIAETEGDLPVYFENDMGESEFRTDQLQVKPEDGPYARRLLLRTW